MIGRLHSQKVIAPRLGTYRDKSDFLPGKVGPWLIRPPDLPFIYNRKNETARTTQYLSLISPRRCCSAPAASAARYSTLFSSATCTQRRSRLSQLPPHSARHHPLEASARLLLAALSSAFHQPRTIHGLFFSPDSAYRSSSTLIPPLFGILQFFFAGIRQRSRIPDRASAASRWIDREPAPGAEPGAPMLRLNLPGP